MVVLAKKYKKGQGKVKKGHGKFNLGRGKTKKTPSPTHIAFIYKYAVLIKKLYLKPSACIYIIGIREEEVDVY